MEKFIVKISCKPYVRRYIELTFGNPADFSKDKILYECFISKLQKKSLKYDSGRYKSLNKYPVEIDIKISRELFYRHGWELSKTDIVSFNLLLEKHAKLFMLKNIGIYKVLGYSLSACIDYFQSEFGFTEDIWPKESIYKECQRNLNIEKGNIEKYLKIMIEQVVLVKKT